MQDAQQAGLLTRPPRRLFHPPALSLPRQTLRPGTRRIPRKAAAPRLTLVSRFSVLGSEARTKLADLFSILLGSSYAAGPLGKAGSD